MYVYYTDPHLFYECLITVVIAFLHTSTIPPRPPKKKKKKNLYCRWQSEMHLCIYYLQNWDYKYVACFLQYCTRSSHQKCSMQKGVLRNFTKFTGKHCARVSFILKLKAWPATWLKKRLWHRCFPVNFFRNF